MIEVSPMEFCSYITDNNLKTSRKLSTLDGDNQTHVMVDRNGKVFAKSTKVKNKAPNPHEWDIHYYVSE